MHVGSRHTDAPDAEGPLLVQHPPHLSVLVVDDNDDLVTVIVEILDVAGHRPIPVRSDGQVCFRLFDELKDTPIDVVISDVYMPGIDGFTLYDMAVAKRPELAHRFMFITGDATNPDVEDVVKRTGALLLAKPFSYRQLVDAVARLASAHS